MADLAQCLRRELGVTASAGAVPHPRNADATPQIFLGFYKLRMRLIQLVRAPARPRASNIGAFCRAYSSGIAARFWRNA